MNILGVIPARGGSKGIPLKNIKDFLGEPLIAHTIKAACSSMLTKIIVSTDHEEIAKTAMQYGAEVPFLRPPELSGDNAASIPVAIHALQQCEKIMNKRFDALMLLQPTTPLRSTQDINDAILIFQDQKPDAVISVVDVGAHHPARMKYIHDGMLVDPPFCETTENQNRQELPQMFIRNGAIYLTRRDVLLSGSYKGNRCAALVMPHERSVNIDTAEDFEYAIWVANRQKK